MNVLLCMLGLHALSKVDALLRMMQPCRALHGPLSVDDPLLHVGERRASTQEEIHAADPPAR